MKVNLFLWKKKKNDHFQKSSEKSDPVSHFCKSLKKRHLNSNTYVFVLSNCVVLD